MAAAKGSRAKAKIAGEAGSPWRVPLCNLKYGEVRPLVVTAAVGSLNIEDPENIPQNPDAQEPAINTPTQPRQRPF